MKFSHSSLLIVQKQALVDKQEDNRVVNENVHNKPSGTGHFLVLSRSVAISHKLQPIK